MTSDDKEPAEADLQQLLARIQSALNGLTGAVNLAHEVIYEAGAVLARLEGPTVIRFDEALASRNVSLAAEAAGRPSWNSATRVFSIAGRIVKQFRVPAHNQEAILAAFEEEGWPHRIDDPLPYCAGVKAKYRLHFTIGRLNQSVKQRLIRFFGDGTGEGICWKTVETAADILGGPAEVQANERRAA